MEEHYVKWPRMDMKNSIRDFLDKRVTGVRVSRNGGFRNRPFTVEKMGFLMHLSGIFDCNFRPLLNRREGNFSVVRTTFARPRRTLALTSGVDETASQQGHDLA